MKYRLVLWDFDGTLADTSLDVWGSLAFAAERCGGRLPAEIVRDNSHLGKPIGTLFRFIDPFPGEAMLAEFERLVRVHYRKMNDYAGTNLYPGVLPLIGELRRSGITNFIVTNKPREALEHILAVKGWARLFDGWITPDETDGQEMTKSEMITSAIGRFKVERRHCVYVGDTWSDVEAARLSGIDCIAVTYGDGDEQSLRAQSPTFCVADVDAVSALLKKGE